MTSVPTGVGLLAAVVYFGTVVASLPLTLVVYAVSRRTTVREALVYVGIGAGGLVLVGGVALAAFVDPVAGATFVALAAGAALVLAGFPLLIGRQLLERWTGIGANEALEYAVLGWPVGLVASLVAVIAPGGLGRYNITFLSGAVGALAWTLVGLVVTLGPAVAGFGMYRLVERLR